MRDYSKGLKDLTPFEALGLAYGAGIGFFVLLRPGLPRDLTTAGRLPGLFLLPWSELDLVVEAPRFPYFKASAGQRSRGPKPPPERDGFALIPVPNKAAIFVESISLGTDAEHIAFVAKRNVH